MRIDKRDENKNSNTGSDRNTQKFKSAKYGIALATSAERMSAMTFEAPESLAQG